MSASQPALFNVQEFTDNGVTLVGGRLYTYAYGTTAFKAAYTDPGGTVPQTYTADGLGGQYIALNARGELATPMYLGAGSYDISLKRMDGSTVWTRKADGVDNASNALGSLLASNSGAASVGYKPPGDSILSNALAQLNKNIYASNYSSLQRAHDAVVEAGGGILWIDGTIIVNATFNWDYNKVMISGVHGMEATLDFRTMPGPASPDIDIFAFNWMAPTATKARKTIQNLRIIGPAASVGVSCFPLLSTVGDAITNINFFGVTIVDFETQLFFGSQCSNIYFSLCHFTNSGENFRTSTVIKTATSPLENGGECWNFSQCQINNVKTIVENNTGIAGGWSFDQCALVYFDKCFDLRSPCRISVGSGSHIESNSYINNWFSTNGNGCIIRCVQTEFWFAGNVTKEIFFSNANTVFGGIFLQECDYHADTFNSGINYLADQSNQGPIYAHGWRCQDSIPLLPFGNNPGVQIEAWPASSVNFANSLIADAGDASVVGITAAQPYNGNVTQIGTNAVGQTMRRYKRYRINGGQVIAASVFIKSTGFQADGSSFAIYVTILDENGVPIGGGNPFSITAADVNNYQRVSLNWYPMAPHGSAFFEFRVFATASINNISRNVFIAEMTVNPF